MCIFCDIINGDIPSRTVFENDTVKAILDIAPLTKGHVIVLAKQHVTSLLEADEDYAAAVMKETAALAKKIVAKTGADGCNIMINCHEAAGQSVDHMHFHIIPRYAGDSIVELHSMPAVDPDEVFALLSE